jgi:predicted transcriptional regulator
MPLLRLAAELQIMESLWNQGRPSIREIQEAFPESDRPPYTTIQTTVYRLEEKGAVRRVRKIGNAHIFEALISGRKQGEVSSTTSYDCSAAGLNL